MTTGGSTTTATAEISHELTKAEHPRATGAHEPDARRKQTKKPPTTHQP